ncbi:MAG: hypothetical protein KAU20_05000 [Nanoarchaeota archaeon]|nr:hypothetical protein [Nanoarchaeota archaeon]
MTKPEILEEKPISMAELKKEMENTKDEDEEPNFRVVRTKEYLNQFIVLDVKKAQELREKIEKLKIPRLKEEYIIKILDILPTRIEDLKSILQAYTITITNDNIKRIVETVKPYAK